MTPPYYYGRESTDVFRTQNVLSWKWKNEKMNLDPKNFNRQMNKMNLLTRAWIPFRRTSGNCATSLFVCEHYKEKQKNSFHGVVVSKSDNTARLTSCRHFLTLCRHFVTSRRHNLPTCRNMRWLPWRHRALYRRHRTSRKSKARNGTLWSQFCRLFSRMSWAPERTPIWPRNIIDPENKTKKKTNRKLFSTCCFAPAIFFIRIVFDLNRNHKNFIFRFITNFNVTI